MVSKHQKLLNVVNNMNAFENMRLNQSRFKQSGEAGKFSNLSGGVGTSLKRDPLKTFTKALKVRFSLDRESEEEPQ